MRLFLFSILILSLLSSQSLADVQITNMNDIALGSWGGSGDLQGDDSVCIYSTGSADYLVTASGSGAGSAFELTSGSDTLTYEVRYNDGGSFVQLTTGNSQAFTGASSTVNCGGGTNGTLRVTVRELDLSGVLSGSYSGTLTVVIDPN